MVTLDDLVARQPQGFFATIVDPSAPRLLRWLLGRDPLSVSTRWSVSGIDPSYGGQAIRGDGLHLLVDISERFRHARRRIDRLPDLVRWDDLHDAVEAIRWDAARHAAELSRTQARWNDVARARDGSPQAVLRARLAAERADELAILHGYQRMADRLMNRAGDAIAAAEVATELGLNLTIAEPGDRAREARVTLEAPVERLDAIAEAWRALDVSTDLLAESLRHESAQRDGGAADRARELSRRLERAMGVEDDGRDADDRDDGESEAAD